MFRWLRALKTAKPAAAAPANEAYDRLLRIVRSLDTRYPLKSSSANLSPIGVTLVFVSLAEREKAERDGTTACIAEELRALAAQQGFDIATALRIVNFADMDAIRAAGGEYNFFR